jgi:hypothetical protein
MNSFRSVFRNFIGFVVCSQMVLLSPALSAQGVRIGNSPGEPDASSILEVESTQKGFLPPRMSESERNAISAPAEGLQVFNTTSKCLEHFVNGVWQSIHCACAPPAVTSSTPASRCGAGELVISATASAGSVYWYDSPSAGNLLGTGLALNTGVLNSSSTFYAEAVDGVCVSASRTAVTATVIAEPVVAPITGPDEVIAGSSIQLACATPGGVWSSSSNALLTVDGNGLATGVSAGSPVVSYAVTENGCTVSVTYPVTVEAMDPCDAAGGQMFAGNCWVPTNVGLGQAEINCSTFCASLGKTCNSTVMQAISQSDATNIVHLFHPGVPMTSCGDAPAYQWNTGQGCYFVEGSTCTHNDNVAGRERYCVCTPWP